MTILSAVSFTIPLVRDPLRLVSFRYGAIFSLSTVPFSNACMLAGRMISLRTTLKEKSTVRSFGSAFSSHLTYKALLPAESVVIFNSVACFAVYLILEGETVCEPFASVSGTGIQRHATFPFGNFSSVERLAVSLTVPRSVFKTVILIVAFRALFFVEVAVIVTVPSLTPEISPLRDTVATFSLLDE